MLTKAQIDALVAKGIEKADNGHSIMLKFLLEQVFGKAPQPLTGGRTPFTFKVSRFRPDSFAPNAALPPSDKMAGG
jgi:hypothetical protein